MTTKATVHVRVAPTVLARAGRIRTFLADHPRVGVVGRHLSQAALLRAAIDEGLAVIEANALEVDDAPDDEIPASVAKLVR